MDSRITLFFFHLLIVCSDQLSAVQPPGNNQNRYNPAPNLPKPKLTASTSLFKFDCMRVSGWHIKLVSNGHLYIYCVWNAKQAFKVAYSLLPQNHKIAEAEQQSEIWTSAINKLDRDMFVSVCALKCTVGVPSPRYTFDGSRREPDAVNVGCRDWQNMQCKASCPANIFNVPNGNVICTSGTFTGSECKLSCRVHFRAVGSDTRLCHPATNKWQPEQPFACEAARVPTCHRLPLVRNGRLHCSHSNHLLSRCALTCRSGHTHVGPLVQWCLPDSDERLVWYMPSRNGTNGTAVTSRFGGRPECRPMVYGNKQSPPPPNSNNEEDRENKRVETSQNATYILKRFDVCDVQPNLRIDCGLRGVSQSRCENSMCCWDSSQENVPWCYKTASNPANEAIKPGALSTGSQQQQRPMAPTTISASRSPSSGNFYQHGSGLPGMQLRPHPFTKHKCGCADDIWARCNTGFRRVFCGQNAKASTFPWNVLIYFQNDICGGTLVAEKYVLTAGHCIRDFQGDISKIRNNFLFFGLSNTSDPDNSLTQVRSISFYYRHPNFTLTNTGHSTNDIAVIKMNEAVKMTSTVSPLCMPYNRRPTVEDECVIMGFGETSDTTQSAKVLQAASVPLVTLLQCRRYYPDFLVSGQNICAGSNKPGSADTCRGDSGGSLACKSGGTARCSWFLAGITSFGKATCGGVAAPSVYVAVSYYQPWIYRTIEHMESYAG